MPQIGDPRVALPPARRQRRRSPAALPEVDMPDAPANPDPGPVQPVTPPDTTAQIAPAAPAPLPRATTAQLAGTETSHAKPAKPTTPKSKPNPGLKASSAAAGTPARSATAALEEGTQALIKSIEARTASLRAVAAAVDTAVDSLPPHARNDQVVAAVLRRFRQDSFSARGCPPPSRAATPHPTDDTATAAATGPPRPPHKPAAKVVARPYAAVAAAGVLPPKPSVPASNPAKHGPSKVARKPATKPQPAPRADDRLIVELSQESPFRKFSEGSLMGHALARFSPFRDLILSAHHVDSGVAFSPLPGKASGLLQKTAELGAAFCAPSATPRTPWIKLAVEGVPCRIGSLSSAGAYTETELPENKLKDSTASAFGCTPPASPPGPAPPGPL